MIKPKNNNGLSIEGIRKFVQWWNNTYPIDYWWRQKYKIPFGSQKHKDQNVLDMRIEFEEAMLVKEQTEQIKPKDRYRPGAGSWLMKRSENKEITAEEADDLFESLDIAALQKQDLERQASGDTSKDISIKKR